MRKITLENGKVVEISQESYDALAKAVQEKRWKPQYDDEYYMVDDIGCIDIRRWDCSYLGEFRYSQRNVFKTKEEAEKHLEYLKALAVLKDDAEDWRPDWSDNDQYKWSVYYNHNAGRLFTYNSALHDTRLHFETKEQAQDSIDTHEKEWLTVFGVER